jgi:hypothetical protein
MPLRAIVGPAEPNPEAGWIQVSAGTYATVVAMSDVDAVLLCDILDDLPIPAEPSRVGGRGVHFIYLVGLGIWFCGK